MLRRHSFVCGVFLLVMPLAVRLPAAEPARSPGEWLEWFSQQWDEKDWPNKYMRPLGDRGWQARMLAMQGLVAGKDRSLPVMLEALRDGSAPQRILSAQALGFLAPRVPREPLLDAIRNDDHAAVRIHAVDALQMQGGADPTDELASATRGEQNRDVKQHVGYAQIRKQHGIDPQIVQELIAWDPATINSAKVGKPAPDFQLKSVTDETVRLSQFRGKKAVVLVFIYGDT